MARAGGSIPTMVSDKDRAHFRVIAEAMDRVNREAVETAARTDPGKNIEIGLRLSCYVPQPHEERLWKPPVALITLWRARKGGRE